MAEFPDPVPSLVLIVVWWNSLSCDIDFRTLADSPFSSTSVYDVTAIYDGDNLLRVCLDRSRERVVGEGDQYTSPIARVGHLDC